MSLSEWEAIGTTLPANEQIEHALAGYETRRAEFERKIKGVRLRLRGTQAPALPRPRHVPSPEDRTRIAATRQRSAGAHPG